MAGQHLSIADLTSRMAPMAEGKPKKWIKKATANSHGQFRAKAEAAGKTTRAFAEEKKDAGGTLGKQANLALNLMGASHGSSKKSPRREALYGK